MLEPDARLRLPARSALEHAYLEGEAQLQTVSSCMKLPPKTAETGTPQQTRIKLLKSAGSRKDHSTVRRPRLKPAQGG